MLKLIFSTIMFTLFIFVLTGLIYPFTLTGVAQMVFPYQANGSLIINSKQQIIGSLLIGQAFTLPQYFHPRPSVNNYDAANSSGSNLGPTSRKLFENIQSNKNSFIKENGPSQSIPIDAVTSSASGLDHHITLANALSQISRIAKTRHAQPEKIRALLYIHKESGLFSKDAYVNVLKLNRLLDIQAK